MQALCGNAGERMTDLVSDGGCELWRERRRGMQEAIYGLLGVLGGAAVTGATAYWGPLQVQKTARRDAEREREQARAEAAAAKAHELRSSRVARVALIRRVVANWCHLLEVTVDEVQQGHAADDEFATNARQAREAVTEAIYEGVRDGVVIVATVGSNGRRTVRRQVEGVTLGVFVRRPEGPLRRNRVSDRTMGVSESERTLILDALDLATARVNTLIRVPLDDSRYPEVLEAAHRALDEAGQARADLSGQLMQRLMDIVDLDVIDPRRAPGRTDP